MGVLSEGVSGIPSEGVVGEALGSSWQMGARSRFARDQEARD